jgi:multiple sugar transport system permease protein
VLLTPYAIVFMVFVLFPVAYGLWLARHPASYEKLVDDPVFLRSVFNTLAFLILANQP